MTCTGWTRVKQSRRSRKGTDGGYNLAKAGDNVICVLSLRREQTRPDPREGVAHRANRPSKQLAHLKSEMQALGKGTNAQAKLICGETRPSRARIVARSSFQIGRQLKGVHAARKQGHQAPSPAVSTQKASALRKPLGFLHRHKCEIAGKLTCRRFEPPTATRHAA